MATTLKLVCDCGATHETAPIRKSFVSFSGRAHGLGQWHMPDINAAVEPSGWVWSDPYTQCTYCPKCWAEIEGKTDAA